MQAIVHEEYGSPDVLSLSEVAMPTIGDREVLVRVRAASVNYGDWANLTGEPFIARLALGFRKPKITVRGRDVAGQVEDVGAAVTAFRPGDEVFAEVESGSFAEYAVVPEKLLALKPRNLTFEQAAAAPLAGSTALQGLRETGNVQPGQRVLVNGASGGVGTFAVQIARALGAEVTAVCSTGNVEAAAALGAQHVIDYAREDFTASGTRFDLIFDLVGNHSLSDLRRALTPKGTLVLSSGAGGRVFGPIGRLIAAMLLSPFVSQSLRPLTAMPSRDRLDALTRLIESGSVTPAIDRTYPLSEVADALRYFGDGHARAKIVITL